MNQVTIRVTCNNPSCNFVGNYHNATKESVIATRNLMSKIPCIDGECPHTDITVQEIQN